MNDRSEDVITVSADDVVEVIPPEKVEIVTPGTRTPSERSALLPTFGAALLWTGRVILPRLLNLTMNFLDRRTQSPPTPGSNPGMWTDDPRQSPAPRGRGRAGRQSRRRQRQGGRGKGRGC
jgi:hypothetical protein